MKKILTVFAAVALMAMPIYAQKKATKAYQRPSLHTVLMTTATASTKGTAQIADPEILGYAADSWTSYTKPALYNDFRIPFETVEVGTVKGSIMDVLAQFNSPASFQGLGIGELKNIVEMLQGQKYREDLKKEVDKVADKVAHELVAKWWGIQPDGTWSDTLLMNLACYSATQNQAANAAETTMGAANQLYNDLATVTMATTFVTFTKLDFYESEPVAAFVRNIMNMVADMTPSPGDLAVRIAAAATYEAMKEGYTAFTNALLYQLEWNDSIANEFYTLWTPDNKIDMEKFNAMKFNMKFVGATKASQTCLLKKGDKGKGAQPLVQRTIFKTLDKQFADLQMKYEDFRPMVPILGIDAKGGIIADMGTKEGVKVGDKFNILEPVTNDKGVTKYVLKGTVKVVKWKGEAPVFENGVWNNADVDNATAATNADGSEDVVGTHLSKFKNASTSMFVKRTKK
jgi:hypothetical protein